MATNIEYSYNKVRKNFGKQPMFNCVPGHLIDSISPNKGEQGKYILRNPVHNNSQVSITQKVKSVNTTTVIYEKTGVNHTEGGWPKEINHADEESTSRHRRRVERDETYIDAVLGTKNRLVKCIKQNNAIEMYEMFFRDMKPVQPVEKSLIRLNNMYRDSGQRPISSLSWTIEDDAKMVVAYCNRNYPIKGPVNRNYSCSVWCLDNPNEPAYIFLPPSACWQAICSPANPSLIVGGLEDGRVCIFDIRCQEQAVSISPAHLAHREPVTSVVYIQSRLNFEFFSGSTDGNCMWWDVRNLSANTDNLIMSVRGPPGEVFNLAYAEPVTALQFDKSFPTKFLCGTDTGLVINVNRRGKTHKEMMSAVFEAHLGPVKAVHRSPCMTKIFITCGDWTTHVWSEDIPTSPIINGTLSRYQINDVSWAPQRLSAYMTVSADGVFRIWDLLRKYSEPTKSLLLSKTPLLKVEPHQEGRLVAIGDDKGNVYSLTLSHSLAISADNDKQLMLQNYEREHHREYILEGRVKEIRLKQTETLEKAVGDDEGKDGEAVLKKTEDEFKMIVAEEIRRTGYNVQVGGSRKKLASKKKKR